MQWNPQLDDEPLVDGSVPIAGVNNSLPPSSIDKTLAADALNRLTQQDGLNRPRPGIIRRQTTGSSLDSTHHVGDGIFIVNDASNWKRFDSRANTLTSLTGGPPFVHGDQVYSALSGTVLYFSAGSSLWKYDPATNFGLVTIPAPYVTAKYPVWALFRLGYVYQNSLVLSDILDPEVFDTTNQIVTLDPVHSDEITGWCLWQNQTLAVFRHGSTWMVETGPNLPIVDWEINRASATVGCACHGTIVQCGVDVFFLSETGRGVYALSQMPTSNQMGVWQPISQPVKRYIDRINWAAIACARATYWNDLYMLSVPLDGLAYNNFILIFEVSSNTWQGIWCFDTPANVDVGVRDYARDRTNSNETYLLIGTVDGLMSQMTYPQLRQYFDQAINGTHQPYESSLMSRSFTFSEDVNQIQPHSMRLQFLESADPVDLTIWADRTIQLMKKDSPTNNYLLQLTIPRFPFDLDKEGYFNLPLSLMSVGICTEIQVELEGTGNWTLFQIKTTAFEAMPLMSI